jgi:hypothetical protein
MLDGSQDSGGDNIITFWPIISENLVESTTATHLRFTGLCKSEAALSESYLVLQYHNFLVIPKIDETSNISMLAELRRFLCKF